MEAVHDGLGRLDGVAKIEIELQENLVTVTPATDRTLDLAAVPRAIQRAGFRPGRMRIRAMGAIESSAAGSRVRFAGWPITYAWLGPAQAVRQSESFEAAVDPATDPPVFSPIHD